MKGKLLLIAGVAVALGCSKSPVEVAKGHFVKGCTSSGADESICSCAFDHMAAKFPASAIARADATGDMPPEMAESLGESIQQCQ